MASPPHTLTQLEYCFDGINQDYVLLCPGPRLAGGEQWMMSWGKQATPGGA